MNDNNETHDPKIKSKGMVSELLDDALNLNYGILSTVRYLFTNPKKVVLANWHEDITDYYGPFKYLFFSIGLFSLIFFLVVDYNALYFESIVDDINTISEIESVEDTVYQLTYYYVEFREKLENDYSGLSSLAIWLFLLTSFSSKWLKSADTNFVNHFRMNAYFIGHAGIIRLIVALPLFFWNPSNELLMHYLNIMMIITVVYMIYGYLRVFYDGTVKTTLISIVVPVLGFLLYDLILALIAYAGAMIKFKYL